MRKIMIAVMGVALLAVAGTVPASAASANTRFVVTLGGDTAVVGSVGVIKGTGVDVTLKDIENDDGTSTSVERLDFPKGKVYLSTVGHNTSESFDEARCIFRFTGVGTFTVTGGTGIYKGISGDGTFTVRGTGIGHHVGDECSDGSFTGIVRAKANIKL